MDNFLQQLINGLTLGSIYGLIAIGYTMVFGIIGMVNFAHGDVFMLSAFIALIIFMILTQILHLGSLPLAFVIVLVGAMALTGLWNWAIEWHPRERATRPESRCESVAATQRRKCAAWQRLLGSCRRVKHRVRRFFRSSDQCVYGIRRWTR